MHLDPMHGQSIVAFDQPRHPPSAQSPTHESAWFPQAEEQSAATLVRRGGCLRSCGLFNGNRVCAVDEAIEAHSLNRHAPGSAQRHGLLH